MFHFPSPLRTVSSAGVFALVALLAGCSGDPEEEAESRACATIPLVPTASPRPASEVIGAWGTIAEEGISVDGDDEQMWIRTTLPASAWKRGGDAGWWNAPRPFGTGLREMGNARVTLAAAAGEFRRLGLVDRESFRQMPTDTFTTTAHEITLRLPPDEIPPEGIRFSARTRRATRTAAGWRPVVGGFTGDGFPLWAGEEVTLEREIPVGATLRFHFAAEPFLSASPTQEVILTVALDDRELVHEQRTVRAGAAGERFAIALPPADAPRPARLTFRVEGSGVRAAIFAPRLTLDVAPDSRPDLIFFLADTFRADNLAAGGGAEGLTPFLDELAAASVLFPHARSNSTWTLPAHATLFTGYHAPQHGVETRDDGLAPELVTLAELLGDAGYRTVAITDSGFVSRLYGLDRGFELFRERKEWSLRETLAEVDAVLADDDGRPLFLFVHSYRMHVPYRVGPDEDATEFRQIVTAENPGSDEEVSRRFLALYREAARDLDAALAEWFRPRRERGEFDDAWFLFTSDHGEEFREHGHQGHGGEPWEEEVRIPLFLYGPGLDPAVRDDLATLLDLPSTILSLVGLPIPEAWAGRDLLASPVARSRHLYGRRDETAQLVILDGARKVFVALDPEERAGGSVERAFDLAADPGERHDRTGTPAAWIEALWRDARARVAKERIPKTAAPEVELTEEAQRHLEAIGYGGK